MVTNIRQARAPMLFTYGRTYRAVDLAQAPSSNFGGMNLDSQFGLLDTKQSLVFYSTQQYTLPACQPMPSSHMMPMVSPAPQPTVPIKPEPFSTYSPFQGTAPAPTASRYGSLADLLPQSAATAAKGQLLAQDLEAQLEAFLAPFNTPPPDHHHRPHSGSGDFGTSGSLGSLGSSRGECPQPFSGTFSFDDLEVDLLSFVSGVHDLPQPALSHQPDSPCGYVQPGSGLLSPPSTASPAYHANEAQKCDEAPTEPAPVPATQGECAQTLPTPPAGEQQGHDTDESDGQHGLVLKVKGRRRTKAELARMYVCKERSCPKQFEHWRSLQYHYWAAHRIRCRKSDYKAATQGKGVARAAEEP